MGIRRRFGQYWSEFCQKMSNNFRSSDSDFFDVAAAGAAILSGRKSHFSTAVGMMRTNSCCLRVT